MHKLVEAERALMTDKHYTKSVNSKEVEGVIPNGAAGFFLLGIIAEKLNRKSDALNAFKRSLDLDPFMWCSYEKICKLNPYDAEPSKKFSELNPKILMFLKKYSQQSNVNVSSSSNQKPVVTLNIPLVNNNTNINQPPKDFSLSPDNTNFNNNTKFNNNSNTSTENKFNNIQHKKQVNRFDIINTAGGGNNSVSNDDNDKNKSLFDLHHSTGNQHNNLGISNVHCNQFNLSSSGHSGGQNLNLLAANPNMTPVVNKEKYEHEYNNLNIIIL
jgi:hypothetical protein